MIIKINLFLRDAIAGAGTGRNVSLVGDCSFARRLMINAFAEGFGVCFGWQMVSREREFWWAEYKKV